LGQLFCAARRMIYLDVAEEKVFVKADPSFCGDRI